MPDTEMLPADLLGTLVALDPAQRRELATTLRRVADNLAEVARRQNGLTCWALSPKCSTRADLSRKWSCAQPVSASVELD